MKWKIYSLRENKITREYESDHSLDDITQFSRLEVSPHAVHLQVPDGADPDCVVVEEDADGNLQLVESSELVNQKKQSQRDAKLAELRRQRDKKLEKADAELFKHQDSDETAVGTYSAWQNYRKALRRITDSYKRSSDSSKGKAALDSYEVDMSDFDGWPTKPS